jgi:hypothetical protein
MASLPQPGNSSQPTGTHRLRRTSLPKASGGGGRLGLVVGAVGGAAVGAGSLAGPGTAVGSGSGRGPAQPANTKIHSSKAKAWKRFTVRLVEQETNMWLILLEALGAGLILVLIVWWTMSGRTDNDDKDPD